MIEMIENVPRYLRVGGCSESPGGEGISKTHDDGDVPRYMMVGDALRHLMVGGIPRGHT